MNMKNTNKKIGLSKFTIVSFLIISMLVFLSMFYQYTEFSKNTLDTFKNENYSKSMEIREKFRLIFDKIQYEFIQANNENISKLDEFYELYKNQKEDLNLTKIADELNKDAKFGKYQVILINKNYVVEKSSYKSDIGLNLGEITVVKKLFDDVFDKKIDIDISSTKIDSESNLKRYLIKLSDDEKYILQLGYSLNYGFELQKQFKYFLSNKYKIDVYLATEFFVQSINDNINITNDIVYNSQATKKFLSEINVGLKSSEIDKMLESDIAKYTNFNEKIEKIFPINTKLLNFTNTKENMMDYYSFTDSLFGKSSDTLLLIKTSFPLEPLDLAKENNLMNFILTVFLIVLILMIFTFFVRREITSKIISITKKIQNNEKIEDDKYIIEEISVLRNSYNEMLEKLNNQIEVNKELSYVDSLTKLRNRKAYDEKIEEIISLYKRYKSTFSIAILDIDDFKKINDTYGHSAGDDVLKDIAKILEASVRSSDIVFRIGGEEFVVIFPNTSLSESKIIVQTIRKNIDTNLMVGNTNITISIGLSEISVDDCKDSIFKRIDKLLYISKNSGKNRVTSE